MMREQFILILALLCGISLVGCTARSRTLSPDNRSGNIIQPGKASALAVHVFNPQAVPGANNGELLIPAALSVEGAAVVLAEREGRIIEAGGREGASVKKGDVLARFNDEDQRTQLKQAELEVSRLQVEEQQYEALLKLSRSELEREQTLQRDGVSSKADVERAQYKLDQSIKEYEKTKLASAGGQLKVRAAQIEVEKSVVRAPIAGVITHRYVTLGTSVAQNEKLFEVSRLTPLEVKFQLPQTENRRLHAGEIINLSAVSGDQIIARARVRRLDPTADATSNTFGYLADIVGGSGLMPGLAVNVHLSRGGEGVSFWIPRAAFPAQAELRTGGSSPLFLTDGSHATSRLVLLNSIEGDQVEVTSGLSATDRVILSPPRTLKDGDPIEIGPS